MNHAYAEGRTLKAGVKRSISNDKFAHSDCPTLLSTKRRGEDAGSLIALMTYAVTAHADEASRLTDAVLDRLRKTVARPADVSNPETDQRRRNLTLKPKDNIDDLQQLCSQRFKRLQTLTTPTFAIAAWMMTAASISWGKHSRQGVLPDGRDQARGYLNHHQDTARRGRGKPLHQPATPKAADQCEPQ
ncbi:hypothetical protein NKH61_23490 [Mesorhizobium sp. M1005]|uniref:hypothetical protein n=1 Tax=unclassified Mesorhizobium TaxID=325217 RepID=UPI00333C2F3C